MTGKGWCQNKLTKNHKLQLQLIELSHTFYNFQLQSLFFTFPSNQIRLINCYPLCMEIMIFDEEFPESTVELHIFFPHGYPQEENLIINFILNCKWSITNDLKALAEKFNETLENLEGTGYIIRKHFFFSTTVHLMPITKFMLFKTKHCISTCKLPPLQGRPLFLFEKVWWCPNFGGVFLNIFPTVENFWNFFQRIYC